MSGYVLVTYTFVVRSQSRAVELDPAIQPGYYYKDKNACE